jgi:hypothetical protein
MIRVEIVHEVERRGVFAYRIPSIEFEGRSRQPLLDACRVLKSMGARTEDGAGLFKPGRSTPDLTCRVGVGAGLTVSEPSKGGCRFAPWREFGAVEFAEAAE